jgi:hypothetical protein
MSARVAGPRCGRPLGPLDPRDHAWREDLADIALAGLVAVPHYVAPSERVVVRQTPLLTADRADAPAASELLPGERFALLDSGHGYGWGYSVHDHYVGHVALDALETPAPGPDTPVGPGDALLFAAPHVKAPVIATLPLGARVQACDHDARFVEIAAGAHAGLFLHRRHLLAAPAPDWVAVAEQFLGAPYRWGGRSRAGVDCSGLVQVARLLGGFACRRDSDMQAADASPVAPGDARRGDLACWPGHIGVMLDGERLLHANAHWMACVIEPLAEVEARAGVAAKLRRP